MSDYAASTHHSQQPLRRFAHVRRFERALELLQIAPNHSVLDLGAGDGYFLARAAAIAPGAQLAAVEPDRHNEALLCAELRELIDTGRLRVSERGDELPDASFDRLVCLEVMEHLPPRLQREALALLHQKARPQARLVLSVPIEVGPVLLIKALSRSLSGESIESWSNLFKALIGRSVPRADVEYIVDHTGFRFQDLQAEIEQSPWRIEHREFSPLPFGSWMLNSQALYVLGPRPR